MIITSSYISVKQLEFCNHYSLAGVSNGFPSWEPVQRLLKCHYDLLVDWNSVAVNFVALKSEA